MLTDSFTRLFYFDALSGVMIALVSFVGLVVGLFAVKHLQGDSQYNLFFRNLGLLVVSVMTMAVADNVLLFFALWVVSNLFLVRLMIHQPAWKAAVNSGWQAGKVFIVGFICLFSAFILLYHLTGQTSIQGILRALDTSNPRATIAMALILIAAMSQSAVWPFHRWLISSLNSPTPVSAVMHAGLVNGGGFLLLRFSPLYFSQPSMLTVIFILGLSTALVGTLWKLMQSDIKRMLACSTMAQMGFMFLQCGLGLFPAAAAHLCWHSLFKANLFLAANGTAEEKRFSTGSPPKAVSFFLALLCGAAGSYLFSLATHKRWLAADTTFILFTVVFIAAVQFSLALLETTPWKKLPMTLLLTGLVCTVYGYSVYFVEFMLAPLNLLHPQALSVFHWVGLILLVTLWAMMLFKDRLIQSNAVSSRLPMLYVNALNASQPFPSTITAHRNHYQYKRG